MEHEYHRHDIASDLYPTNRYSVSVEGDFNKEADGIRL